MLKTFKVRLYGNNKCILIQLISGQGGLKKQLTFEDREIGHKSFIRLPSVFSSFLQNDCHMHITMETFQLQSGCVTVQYLRPLRMLMCRLPLITVQPLRD